MIIKIGKLHAYQYSKMINYSTKHDSFENRQYFKRPKINKQDNLVCKYAHAYKNIYLRVKSGWQDRYVCCIKWNHDGYISCGVDIKVTSKNS